LADKLLLKLIVGKSGLFVSRMEPRVGTWLLPFLFCIR